MASGRLGYKCIPAYTSCEIYNNSSGSSASLSISAQVFGSTQDNACITTAVVNCAVTLSTTSTLSSGTNCFIQTVGFNLDGNSLCGTFIKGPENCYSTVNKYINKANTVTTCGARSTNPSPYGGNEIILPTSSTEITILCSSSFRPCAVTVTFDCCGEYPLIIHSLRTQCNLDTQAQLFVNPYCTCGNNATYGYSCATYGFCSVEYITCKLKQPQGAAGDTKDYVINYYGSGLLGGNIYSCGACKGCLYCSLDSDELSLSCTYTCCDAIFVGFGTITAGGPYTFISAAATSLVSCFCCACCVPLDIHYMSSNCGYYGSTACAISGASNLGTALCCRNCWFKNASCGVNMSPYGVQRAATKRLMIWAFCNSAVGTGYYVTSPHLLVGCQFNCCGKGFWTNIPHTHYCEFPVKYLSYNPQQDCVYMMVRSKDSKTCGIYSLNEQTLYNNLNTTGSFASAAIAISNFNESTLFTKVADLPPSMISSQYTVPFMCVSCLFKDSETTWNIRLWNHTTSTWDSFITSDLTSWSASEQYSYVVSNTQKTIANNSCVVDQLNEFGSNVPVCNYIDYGILANNFERTGVVISNGDRIIINNDSNQGISAQIWGYEG